MGTLQSKYVSPSILNLGTAGLSAKLENIFLNGITETSSVNIEQIMPTKKYSHPKKKMSTSRKVT